MVCEKCLLCAGQKQRKPLSAADKNPQRNVEEFVSNRRRAYAYNKGEASRAKDSAIRCRSGRLAKASGSICSVLRKSSS